MTRVLFLAESFHPVLGGGEIHLRQLATALARRGIPATVLTRRSEASWPEAEVLDGVEVRRVGPPGPARTGKYAMVPRVLRALGRLRGDFDVLEHTHTERAADEAAALGIGPEEVAKTLVLTAPAGNVRAVLPASERIDLHKVADELGVGGKNVHLLSEEDLARDYPDFELGAVPPLGGREDQVIVDVRLAQRDSVVFEAGSHDMSVRLKAADLMRLTGAQVANICRDDPAAR